MSVDQKNQDQAKANGDNQDMIKKLDNMFASGGEVQRTKPTLKRNRNVPGLAGDVSAPVTMPAPLAMGAKATLHTHLAVNMFRGRKGDRTKNLREIVGMSLFGRTCGLLWSAARNDDPYADQCILEIERVFNKEKEHLEKREQQLNEMLEGLDGLEVVVQSSTRPVEIPINFHSPWAYRGLQLLLQYDRIVRLSMTAHHVGLIDDKEWNDVVSDSGRGIRHLFEQVNRWYQTGVTREDVRQCNQAAQRALLIHNEKKFNRLILDEAVVSGELRASVAPRSVLLEQFQALSEHKSKQKLLAVKDTN